MPLSATKILFSILAFGSAAGVGVGGYSLNNFLNNKSSRKDLMINNRDKSINVDLISEVSEKDKESLSKNTHKQELLQEKIEKKDIEVKNSPEQLEIFSVNSEVIKEIPQKVEEVVQPQEKDLEVEEIKGELENNKEALEKEKVGMKLEVVWMYGNSIGNGGKQKSCFLLKEGQTKNIPSIMNESDEISESQEEESCESTIFSQNNSVSGNKEGLWIRGKNEQVQEFFNKNLDDLWNSRFIKRDNSSQKPSFISEDFHNNLDQSCSIDRKVEGWLEISCIKEVLVHSSNK